MSLLSEDLDDHARPCPTRHHARRLPNDGTRRLVRDVLRRDSDDRWAATFGLIAGYSFAVAAVTGVLLLPFFRPSMATVIYHGSYAKLNGVPV